ncbi:uncharacterized protein LOC141628198 [Silene latifolia]|uniref:uncharacterized protein LOC141628198 n=1 Tax=Silene latifolia TaxID=37657 RepID=UPI003D774653
MTDNRDPKRYKTLFSWFKNDSSPSIPVDQQEGIELDDGQHERANNQEGLSEQQEDDQDYNVTLLEQDPGKRCAIGMYPLNEQDNVRRAYVAHGPYQPYLREYPCTHHGNQGRMFSHKWFKEWPWLEYSLAKDKVDCFPCFLFDTYPSHHPSFTETEFNGLKNVMSKQSGIIRHIEELAKNRLRLVATIEVVRLLARQGCFFRVHDESVDSPNGGNFDAVLNSFKRIIDEVNKVEYSAPGNAKYTCPTIQKQVANILSNKVRAKIRAEVGSLKERFYQVLSVEDTCSQTLKDEISKVLRLYGLHVKNMRRQGHSMLKACREAEIADFVAAATLEMGSGKNQTSSLQRGGATRWGSHLRSISNLIKLFGAAQSTINDLYLNGVDKV